MPPIDSTSVVIDVGCSSGSFGAFLMEHTGCTVVGIEIDERLASEARDRLSRVFQTDAAEGLARLTAEGITPDVVVFADVLEHLVDPWTVVDLAMAQMPRGGWIVVSLPNVAHVDTLLSLLRGTWPMRDRGIHDDTHLRFFARRDLAQLLLRERSGPLEVTRRYRLVERGHWINRLSRWIGWCWPNGLTFQYLIRVRVAPSE